MVIDPLKLWPTISETPEQFREKQESSKEGFVIPKQTIYWQFNPEQQESNENLQEILNEFKEDPNYPIIERFEKIWIPNSEKNHSETNNSLELEDKTKVEIYKVLKEKWWDNPLQNLKNNLSSISFSNKEQKMYLNNYLEKVIDLNKDKQKVEKNWNEELLELPKEFKSVSILNNQYDNVVQLLIKNYTKIPDWKEWNPDFQKDIKTSFEITANKIIEWKKFSRNESFDIAMKDIKNWDIETRYYALSYINSLVNTSEWLKWIKSQKDYLKIKKGSEKSNNEYLNFKIWKLKQQKKQAEIDWNKKEIERLELKISSLENEKTEWWNIFEAGKIDINENENNKVKES